MNRREFVVGAAAAAGFVPRRASPQARDDEKRARIALMMFGLNSLVRNNMPPSPARTIDIMDIGQLASDRFRIHQVELQSNYLPSTEMSWLRDFKARLARTRTKIVQINLEFGAGLNMGAEAGSPRLQMIDLHRVWLDKAAFLECPRVLLNQAVPSADNRDLLVSNFRAVADLANAKGIIASCENRNVGGGRGRGAVSPASTVAPPGQAAPAPAPTGPQAPAAPSYLLLTEILKASGTRGCVDFLNFPNQEEQHAGIRGMLPITSGLVHAGMRYDLPAAMAICREAGYRGIYSLKAIGLEGDPLENTQKILEGVLAHM